MKNFILIGILAFLYGCSSDKKTIRFNKEDYSGRWPFSVNEIEVYCDGYKEIYMKASNGTIYALNGSAKSVSQNNSKIKDVGDVWLDNPDLPGTKIPYSDFIQKGLELCEDK